MKLHALFIFCYFFHHDHDGANSLTFDVPSCAGFLIRGEGAYAHDVTSTDFDGERFCGIYLSDGEIYGVYIYIHAHGKNGDILSMSSSIQDSRSKLPNMDSTNLQLLYTHQDTVCNTRLLQVKPP